jgi:acetoin utilization deacetylase AcuC-like enzyme
VKAFYSDTFVLPLPEEHRFPMAKYRLLRERLIFEGVLAADDLHVPDAIDLDDLRLVHDAGYVEAVEKGTLAPDMRRRIGFPWSPMMVERSRRSVGATLAAAREVVGGPERAAPQIVSGAPQIVSGAPQIVSGAPQAVSGAPQAVSGAPQVVSDAPRFVRGAGLSGPRVSANLAGGTHHAFRDRGEGYCIFNDVAVAAAVLMRDRAIVRAAVVDCDVHQGNGTAAIFHDEPAVFTVSLHGANNFPFRKEVSDLDVTFDDGTGDAEYLDALARHVPDVLDRHRPDIVFYLAGADPYEGDRLGRLKLTIEGLAERDRFVFAECRARDIPVAITMGGGYCPDVDAIVTIHCNTIREAVRSCQSVFVS